MSSSDLLTKHQTSLKNISPLRLPPLFFMGTQVFFLRCGNLPFMDLQDWTSGKYPKIFPVRTCARRSVSLLTFRTFVLLL
jgi:hypothetical protein